MCKKEAIFCLSEEDFPCWKQSKIRDLPILAPPFGSPFWLSLLAHPSGPLVTPLWLPIRLPLNLNQEIQNQLWYKRKVLNRLKRCALFRITFYFQKSLKINISLNISCKLASHRGKPHSYRHTWMLFTCLILLTRCKSIARQDPCSNQMKRFSKHVPIF